MKKNKKAFTLVELLVVIAILAILATVSILGYTSFTKKAKQSVAEDELLQIKTVLLADWLDGFIGEPEDKLSISKNSEKKYTFTLTNSTAFEGSKTDATEIDKAIKEAITAKLKEKGLTSDISSEMKDKVGFTVSYTKSNNGTGKEGESGYVPPTKFTYAVTLTYVTYVQGNGATATWEIATDEISSVIE